MREHDEHSDKDDEHSEGLKIQFEITVHFIGHILASIVALIPFIIYTLYFKPLLPSPPIKMLKLAIATVKWSLLIEYYVVSFLVFQLAIYKMFRST